MADNGYRYDDDVYDEDRFLKDRTAFLSNDNRGLTRETWTRMCEILSRNKHLTDFGVSLYDHPDFQFHITHLESVLESCRTIESVKIECYPMIRSEMDVSGLIRSLSQNGAVKVCHFWGEAFARVPPNILVDLFQAIRDLKSLTLPVGAITDGPVCAALVELTSLKKATVILEDGMTPEQLGHLGSFLERTTSVEALWIEGRGTQQMTGIEEAIRGLARNHSVKMADFTHLYCRAPYGRAIGHVLQHNRSLIELRLSERNSQEVQDLSEGLKSNMTLETLDLRLPDLPDRPFVETVLPLLVGLKEQKTSGLTSLHLVSSHFGEQRTASAYTVALFHEALQGCSVLREISLEAIAFSDEENESWHQLVDAVINGLCAGSSVQRLKLTGPVRNFNDSIVRLLGSEPSGLKSLEFHGCHLNSEDLDGVADAAARTQRLEELVIHSNEELTSSTELVRLLMTTISLKSLHLRRCSIGDPGAVAFACALYNQTTLESLSLDCCNIKSVGVMALAKMVPGNPTLKHISLRLNRIGRIGAKAIADMLPQTATLKSIDLKDSRLGMVGLNSVLERLERNYSIEQCSISSEDSDEQKQANHLCALNKARRKSYVEADNMRDQDWLKALNRMEGAGGLSTLYFAVRSKPNLIFVRPDSAPDGSTSSTGKRKRE